MLNNDILDYLVGLKLNNHISPKSSQERDKMIQNGKTWRENNKGAIINLY